MANETPEQPKPEHESSDEYSPPWSFSEFTEENEQEATDTTTPENRGKHGQGVVTRQSGFADEAETLIHGRPSESKAQEVSGNEDRFRQESEDEANQGVEQIARGEIKQTDDPISSKESGQKAPAVPGKSANDQADMERPEKMEQDYVSQANDSAPAGEVEKKRGESPKRDFVGVKVDSQVLIETPKSEDRKEKAGRNENPVVIEFENVTKVFRNQVVLRDLSFQIHQGETLCLIGESGCGKTVNLKLMIGLMKPDKGRVSFKGQDLARMNEKQITATRIKFGFLFQMAALFDSMTIYDNVAFGLREHRLMPEKEMPVYIRERLAEVGLPDGVESKKPAELSGGQRKRVGLARALALKPEVMLYDEPTTGLDPIMTDIINELILQTQDHGAKTGIIVTHEMRTVTKCADRVIMLYPTSRLAEGESQILYDGPPEGMGDHPDPRVRQFVRGEAGDRLLEMNENRVTEEIDSGLATMDPDEIVASRPPGKDK